MKLYIKSFNSKRDAEAFINESRIKKDQVVNFFPESSGLFTLVYYAEQ